jgi:hypothetical protein
MPRPPRTPRWVLLPCLVIAAACGSSADRPAAGSGSAGAGSATPLADTAPLPPIGVDAIKRFNYVYGDGASAFDKAQAAARPRDKAKAPDWAGARAHAEAALAKDPDHAGAHRLLAVALVQLGEPAGAAAHLEAALAQDWLGFGGGLADDARLTAYLDTPAGQLVLARSDKLEQATLAIARSGPLVLGRRSAFKWPTKPGVQGLTTRGEVYALDEATTRFVRITHTDHAVAGMLRSPDGKELVVVGYDKVSMPAKDAPPSAAPLLESVWLETYETTTFRKVGVRTRLPASVRAVGVRYGAAGELLVSTFVADGRWRLIASGAPQVVDRSTGKLAASAAAATGPELRVCVDDAWVDEWPALVDATWLEPVGLGSATTSALTVRGRAIDVPSGAAVLHHALRASPDGTMMALVTPGRPCAPDGAAPALYVADLGSGRARHVLSADSRLTARWLDGARLLYEDGDGGLRIWDAATGREVSRLTDKLALDGFSATKAPPCMEAAAPPPPVTPTDLPPDDALPVDELPALDQPTE